MRMQRQQILQLSLKKIKEKAGEAMRRCSRVRPFSVHTGKWGEEVATTFEITGIKKRFPGIVALNWDDNDRIIFEGGVIYALLGENGAGKSTLSKIIAGIYQYDGGEVLLDGVPFLVNNSKEAREMGVGIVLQETGLIDSLKVSENLLVRNEKSFSTAGVYSIQRQYELATEMLKDVCPWIKPSTMVKDLSLENQKMVELARAVYVWPKILLIDETSAALSKENVKILFDKIREAKKNGSIVIMVTHRMEEVFELCDEAVIMKDGKLVCKMQVGETDLDQISRLMVGRAVDVSKTRIRPDYLDDPNNPSMLRAENLTANGLFANVNFNLHRGEIIGIAGLNGGGKDELLPALFGEIPLSDGKLTLDGKDYQVTTPGNSIRHGIAYIPKFRDRDGLMLRQSIKMNILLPLFGRASKMGFLNPGKEQDIAQKYSKELMVKCGTIQDACDTLSGGNRQKVILARWMAYGSKLLLLDNPTRGIDIGARAEIYRLLNKLTAQGYAVLMVSDDLPEIISMSDRVMVIRRGEVSYQFDNTENLTEHDIIIHII